MIAANYLLFYSLLFISLSSGAQSTHVIKKVLATYTVHVQGNIAIDRNGNSISQRDTLNVVYIETAPERIKWTKAWKDRKSYAIVTALITGSFFDAGTNKLTNEKIILRVTGRNKLWKLQLKPEEKSFSPALKGLPPELILEGIYRGKKITQKIDKQTEVVAIPSV